MSESIVRDLHNAKRSRPLETEDSESVSNYTDVGLHFRFDADNNTLYSKEGYFLLKDVKTVCPVRNHPRKAVAKVMLNTLGAVEKIKKFEVLTDNSGELIAVYEVGSDRELTLNDEHEPVDFLPIPEYKAFHETMDEIQDSQRPMLRVQKDRWVWREDVRDSDECTCSTFRCKNDADVKVHAENGRSFAGYMINSGDSTANNYCRYCMDLDPNTEFVKSYYREDTEDELEKVSPDSGYRMIAEDDDRNFRMVVSVSPEDSCKNGQNEYFVTVELVRYDTGNLVDRETPTIYKYDPEEAARRAVELYESFWSGIHASSLSFSLTESRPI